MIAKHLTLAMATASLAFSGLYSTQLMAEDANIIYLTRHAEKLDSGSDPSLSDAGKLRAENIATLLEKADINAIYSTAYNRTLETAAPLSERINVGVQTYDPFDLSGFATSLKTLTGNSVVVGHSNTTPELVSLLGGEAGSAIDESEYDRLYQLIFNQDGSVTTVLFTSLPSGEDNHCDVSEIALSNLSQSQGEWTYYQLDLPECAAGEGNSLTVSISGGQGDADLYVNYGSQPAEKDYECRPYKTGNDESCEITDLTAGTYHIGVYAYKDFSGVSLTTLSQ